MDLLRWLFPFIPSTDFFLGFLLLSAILVVGSRILISVAFTLGTLLTGFCIYIVHHIMTTTSNGVDKATFWALMATLLLFNGGWYVKQLVRDLESVSVTTDESVSAD